MKLPKLLYKHKHALIAEKKYMKNKNFVANCMNKLFVIKSYRNNTKLT